MKNYKYIGLFLLSLGFVSCDIDNTLQEIEAEAIENVALNTNGLDFSKYIAVGASFTAGYTDGAMFKAAQENSFPNILANKFGTDFNQPLMSDNFGGLILAGNPIINPATGNRLFLERLVFGGSVPVPLKSLNPVAMSTTDFALNNPTGPFNNMGVPGAKSFHFLAQGYGNIANFPLAANPYAIRMTGTNVNKSILELAVDQNPTFFTLSEIGGNDVLGYATSGGDGSNPITTTATFDFAFNKIVNDLTANQAKGVVANIPYITSLAHFTTVPYNPLDPTAGTTDAIALASQIPLLNTVYGVINQIYTGAGEPERAIVFSATATNPVVIFDEDVTDLSAAITSTLGNPSNTAFIGFVQSLGLPAQAAPLVAQLLGQQYGKARSAKADDLFVLPSSGVIGKVNNSHAGNLIAQSGGLLPTTLAGQFSAEGVTLPLADKWVLTPQEQTAIRTATDAYNTTIETVAKAKGLALVDFKTLLVNASANGYAFDNYILTTSLVTGGMISLDGIHLTARGYAMMANEMLKAIDTTYGSNFTTATNGLAKAGDYPTNYSPALR